MPIIRRENAKTYLGITVTTKDELIDMLIDQVEADYELIRNREFDIDSNDYIEYPDGSELVAALMIGYQIALLANQGADLDIQSENIGDYSYSKVSGDREKYVHGYPKSITGRIARYIKLK